MKKFILTFICISLIEVTIGILRLSFHNSILSFLSVLISMPLVLIDRSYPFYAEDYVLGIFLTVINVLIQTAIVFLIFKAITKYRKSNSL